jgi:hypothetical protein
MENAGWAEYSSWYAAIHFRPRYHSFHHLIKLIEYVYIGPDYQDTVTLKVSPHISLRMFASVLHLRGGQVTMQPHVSPTTGDVLCWNGEVGFVVLIELDGNRGSEHAGVRRDGGKS